MTHPSIVITADHAYITEGTTTHHFVMPTYPAGPFGSDFDDRQCAAMTHPGTHWDQPGYCETPATYEDTAGDWWCPTHTPVILSGYFTDPDHPAATQTNDGWRLTRTAAAALIRQAEDDLEVAQNALTSARDAYTDAYCDHPDTDGPFCADCGDYAPPTEQQAHWDDHYRVLYADADAACTVVINAHDAAAYLSFLAHR